MADIIQVRRDSSSDWVVCNPTLAQGEFGFELDSSTFKIGDGIHAWIDLPYWITQGGTGIAGMTGVQGYTGIRGLQNFTEFDTTQYPGFLPAELGWSQRDEALFLGVTGMNWIQLGVGFKSMAGVTGLALGSTGLQGIQGPTGPGAGSQGGTGVQGIQGNTGLGIQGVTGLALGSTGISGVTGILGVNGATGVIGLQGVTGLRGVTGLQGTQGGTGIAGVTGFRGVTGFQGITGLNGVTGLQGNIGLGVQGGTGVIGPTGIRGVTGLALGSTGIAGPTGLLGGSGTINLIMRGGDSTVPIGIKGEVLMPWDTQFTGWTLTADRTGKAYIELYDSSYAGYPNGALMSQGTTGINLNNTIKNTGNMSGWSSDTILTSHLLQYRLISDATVQTLSLNLLFNRR